MIMMMMDKPNKWQKSVLIGSKRVDVKTIGIEPWNSYYDIHWKINEKMITPTDFWMDELGIIISLKHP